MRAWKAVAGCTLAGAIALSTALRASAQAAGAAAQPLTGAAQLGQQAGAAAAAQQSERARHRAQARRQLQQEEKQRVLGVVPNFGTTYLWNASSLSAAQKMQLAFRSAFDPFTFAAAALVAGGHEAFNDEPGFQWGPAGFGQRVGAAYLDAFDGDMIGNGILPALLRQDPRYFRMGHGSFRRRLFYAMAATVVCRGDSGRNEPNVSNIGGNLAAGAISNLYYPNQNAGWDQTLGNGLIVTAEGAAGGVFEEFWPDIARKLFHKDPARSADAAVRGKSR